MATIITTAGGQHSGALGGAVFATSRAGAVLRSRPGRAQPASAAQQTVKKNFALSANLWAKTTPAQRAGWAEFAVINPMVNPNGRWSSGAGFQEFCRANALLCWNSPADVWLPPPSRTQRPRMDLVAAGLVVRQTTHVIASVEVKLDVSLNNLTDGFFAWASSRSFAVGSNYAAVPLVLLNAFTPANSGPNGPVQSAEGELFPAASFKVGEVMRFTVRTVIQGATSRLWSFIVPVTL